MRLWLIRLLRHSTFGETCSLSPKRNFFVHEAINWSITTVLDVASSLFPKRNFVHEAKNYRLLRYSIFVRDKIPISQEEFLRPWSDKLSTTSVLDLRTGQVPHLPKGLSYKRQQPVDYYSTRLNPRQDLHVTRRITHPRDDNQSTTTYLTQKNPNQGNHHIRRWRPIDYSTKRIHPSTRQSKNLDYHSTRRNKSRQPMTKATNQSAVNIKESTIHQNVKSTPIDTRIHKN